MRGALCYLNTHAGERPFGRALDRIASLFAGVKAGIDRQANPQPAGRAEDEDALAVAARRNPEAFAVLYRRYVQRVYRYFYSRVNQEAEAEDLTAEVFIAAYEGLGRYRPGGNFAAWLFGIARNKARRYFRRWRPQVSLDQVTERSRRDAADWRPLEDLEQQERLERLEELIANLKPEQLELLRLRFAADLTFAEIAEVLGSTEAAVKMSLYRLLGRLNAEWET